MIFVKLLFHQFFEPEADIESFFSEINYYVYKVKVRRLHAIQSVAVAGFFFRGG